MGARFLVAVGITCTIVLCAVLGDIAFFDGGVVYAQESWKNEFDSVCSKTQDAMGLSENELQDLIKRCDALKPGIEKLKGAQKKVYMRRLKTCRDLYAYVLESKEQSD